MIPMTLYNNWNNLSVRSLEQGKTHFLACILIPIWRLKTMKEANETATAGSDVVQSGRPIFDDFFQHLWPYIGNNTANVVFQMVKRLWLIRIDQSLYIAPQKIV
ncbi:hypothetical protein TNCV_87841 [Trichonephila clavipes]|nr:hypothetical protein TNCV_87841 [Trichonephila clavipes]